MAMPRSRSGSTSPSTPSLFNQSKREDDKNHHLHSHLLAVPAPPPTSSYPAAAQKRSLSPSPSQAAVRRARGSEKSAHMKVHRQMVNMVITAGVCYLDAELWLCLREVLSS